MSIIEWRRSTFSWFVCAAFLWCSRPALPAAAETTHANAAVFYYQAFLLCPEYRSIPNELGLAILRRGLFDERLDDSEFVTQMRRYVRDYGDAIELTESASGMPFCNWGIPDRQGPAIRSKLLASLRSLAFLYGADVQILASDGEYEAALSRCMTLRKLAEHAAQDPGIHYVAPVTIEGQALLFAQRVLTLMLPDRKSLLWLREQLGSTPDYVEALPDWVRRDFEETLATRRNGKTLSWLREQWAGNTADPNTRDRILNYTDDHLLDLMRKAYATFLDNVTSTLTSDVAYDQTYSSLETYVNALEKEGKRNPLVLFGWMGTPETVPELYRIKTSHVACRNAMRVAIEVYLIKADTGRLPVSLPKGAPKDPLSGNDFEYETTKQGFILRCPITPKGFTQPPEYESVVTDARNDVEGAD